MIWWSDVVILWFHIKIWNRLFKGWIINT
jgi:hypothetical protein